MSTQLHTRYHLIIQEQPVGKPTGYWAGTYQHGEQAMAALFDHLLQAVGFNDKTPERQWQTASMIDHAGADICRLEKKEGPDGFVRFYYEASHNLWNELSTWAQQRHLPFQMLEQGAVVAMIAGGGLAAGEPCLLTPEPQALIFAHQCAHLDNARLLDRRWPYRIEQTADQIPGHHPARAIDFYPDLPSAQIGMAILQQQWQEDAAMQVHNFARSASLIVAATGQSIARQDSPVRKKDRHVKHSPTEVVKAYRRHQALLTEQRALKKPYVVKVQYRFPRPQTIAHNIPYTFIDIAHHVHCKDLSQAFWQLLAVDYCSRKQAADGTLQHPFQITAGLFDTADKLLAKITKLEHVSHYMPFPQLWRQMMNPGQYLVFSSDVQRMIKEDPFLSKVFQPQLPMMVALKIEGGFYPMMRPLLARMTLERPAIASQLEDMQVPPPYLLQVYTQPVEPGGPPGVQSIPYADVKTALDAWLAYQPEEFNAGLRRQQGHPDYIRLVTVVETARQLPIAATWPSQAGDQAQSQRLLSHIVAEHIGEAVASHLKQQTAVTPLASSASLMAMMPASAADRLAAMQHRPPPDSRGPRGPKR